MADDEDDAVLQTSMSALNVGNTDIQPHQLYANGSSRGPFSPMAVTSHGVKSRDITAEFVRAASVLQTGGLVKDESFSLFDAVGALEIMDPKMDSGFLAPGDTLEDTYDVARELLNPAQTLGIMDALLSAEVAWQQGHPLSQTLFTSLYVNYLLWPEPETLEDASFSRRGEETEGNVLLHGALRAYCLALIKACHLVHQTICSETYFEEEDFVSNLFNRSLLAQCAAEDVCKLVDDAIVALKAVASNVPMEIYEGLVSRLQYRISFLRAVMAEPRQASPESNAHWQACQAYISNIEDSHRHAISVDRSFSTKTQRRLASTVPPRPIIKLDFHLCVNFLRQLFVNALDAVRVVDCPRMSGILAFVQFFFSQKPQPAVYIRCLLQAMVLERLRGPHLAARREFFFRELEEVVLPAHILTDLANEGVEPVQDARHKIWGKMCRFIEQVYEPFMDIIRAQCMNRARNRRMLCNLLYEWDGLQLDLEDLDNELRVYSGERPVFNDAWELPLSSWAYLYKLRQMQWIIQLGFETQIYHCDEWPGLYQYLNDVATHRYQHLCRIHGFLHHHFTDAHTLPAASRDAISHSLNYISAQADEAASTAALASAFAALYQALQLLSLLPPPPSRPYGQPSLRHALRLRPFLPLCLPVFESAEEPFAAIQRLGTSIQPPASAPQSLPQKHRRALALLDNADAIGRTARKGWDGVSKATPEAAGCVGCETQWRSGIKEILRAAVGAAVVGARVKKWIMAGAQEPLKVEVRLGTTDEDLAGGMAAAWIVPVLK